MVKKPLKVLIIAYYWSPAGGSGVQRWLKFVKYLHRLGHRPVIYTTDAAHYAFKDALLEAEVPVGIKVIRRGYWNPVRWTRFFSRKKTGGGFTSGFLPEPQTFFERLVYYIRANFFIPDAKIFWVRPSVRLLRKELKKNPVDVVISTGPPMSCHLIAYRLKSRLHLPWLTDFRDPWTTGDIFYRLPLSKRSKQKHAILENKVLTTCDAVLTTSKTVAGQYKAINPNTFFIPNGYDFMPAQKTTLDKRFTLAHVGMMNEDRNPAFLWDILTALVAEHADFKKDFQLHLVGKVADSVLTTLCEKGLSHHLKLTDYVPHQQANDIQQKSQLLLICFNDVPSGKTIIAGKLFECMASGRPILATAPLDSDLAAIVQETQSGFVAYQDNQIALKTQLLAWYRDYQEGKLVGNAQNIGQYHREKLTNQLVDVLYELIY